MSSSRFPNKVLKTICGKPLLLVCCKRLLGPNVRLRILTSSDQTDDLIEQFCRNHEVDYSRGSLENVLERYYLNVNRLDDNAIVVRATSDNVVPNYGFLTAMVEKFVDTDCDYMASTAIKCGFAYGLSLEVMYASAIKKAYHNSRTEYEKEHVTPWIKNSLKSINFTNLDLGWPDTSSLECTIDTKIQYDNLKVIFEDSDISIVGRELDDVQKFLNKLK